jgi:3-hydroxyisobutyrate dehydrogenase
MKVGFIGYGLLGKILFQRFYKFNKKLTVYNRTKKKISSLNNENKVFDLNKIFKENKLIFLILYDDKSLLSILKKTEDIYLKNKILINLTTISYNTSNYLSKKFKNTSTVWIDAPIMGSVEAAKKNKLTFLYSGKKNTMAIKYLKLIGNIIFYNQDSASQFLKLCHNSVCSMIMISIGEIFFLSKKYKIKKKLALEMIKNSAFYSPLIKAKISKYENNDFKPSFTYFNMLKDLKYMEGLTKKDAFLLNKTYKIFRSKYKLNYKKKDTSFISKLIENEKI